MMCARRQQGTSHSGEPHDFVDLCERIMMVRDVSYLLAMAARHASEQGRFGVSVRV